MNQARRYREGVRAFPGNVRLFMWGGLFNGLGANTIRALPGAAIQFWAFDFLNDLCRSW